MSPYSKNYLIQKFGFRSYEPRAENSGMGPQEAKALVEGFTKRRIDFDLSDVLLNEDLICVPYGSIGCSGVLVHRRTKEVIFVGSALVPFQAVWAFYHGISLADERPQRLQALVIRAIHDVRGTMRALWYPLFRYPGLHPLAKRLRELPCAIGNLDLLWSIGDLMRAEENNSFEFEVHSSNNLAVIVAQVPGAPDAGRSA